MNDSFACVNGTRVCVFVGVMLWMAFDTTIITL